MTISPSVGRWPWMCLIVILGIAFLFQTLHLSVFNGLSSDDGIFIQYALNVTQGWLGMPASGILLGLDKFHVGDLSGIRRHS